ncbi:MAG: CofH family radical SAM protein [Sedimentisphaerales bacterium]|nr:CofH family radical SAM protein [Sedimentisphaerales bacterium]
MKLTQLITQIEQGKRLNTAEYLFLYETADFHSLAALADVIRTRRHGRQAFYIRNCHINYTNVCAGNCSICTFSRHPDSGNGYTLTIEEIKKIAESAAVRGAVEFHVVGGLNPDLRYDYYVGLVKAIRSVAPMAAIKAFTAVEIDHIAKTANKSVADVLTDLKVAGLGCLPGGGAEIFSASHRQKHFPHKISGERWLEIHRIAHSLKIPTTATMLYNNSETAAERIEHLLKLRNAQDASMQEYGIGFLGFVPLSCKSEPSTCGGCHPASAVLDIRTVAMSRIVLDTIPHIKAFWPILGWDVAQVALLSGADDLDGAIEDYKIVDAPSDGGTVQKMIDTISQIGLTPVERNSFYD